MASQAMIDDPAVAAAREAGASESDISLIRTLKERALEFERHRQELERAGPAIAKTNDYDLMVEYGELLERADSIKSKITAATNAIDKALRAARGVLGSAGMNALSSLGVVWFLPAAIIVAAVSVIGYWIADYQKFAKRFTEQRRIAAELESKGLPPDEAQRQASAAVAAAAPGMFGDFGKVALWGGLLVVGFLVYRQYKAG